MSKPLKTLGVVLATLALGGSFAAAHADSLRAKITASQARQIALRQVPGGRIIDQELEHELGGSGLRYSFHIQVKHRLREVGIDAVTGAVLENKLETDAKDD